MRTFAIAAAMLMLAGLLSGCSEYRAPSDPDLQTKPSTTTNGTVSPGSSPPISPPATASKTPIVVAGHYARSASKGGATWTTWDDVYYTAFFSRNDRDVAAGAGQIAVRVGNAAWQVAEFDGNDEDSIFGVTFFEGQYLAAGQNGLFYTSTDALKWVASTVGSDASFNGIAAGATSAILVGEGGTLLSSTDGLTWVDRRPSCLNETIGLTSIANVGGIFVAGSREGNILRSGNGVAWQCITTGASAAVYDIAYGAGTFIAALDDGSVLRSSDSESWERIKVTTGTEALYTVARGADHFVTGGSSGKLYTSLDGQAWSLGTTFPEPVVNDVYWTGQEYLVSLGLGVIAESKDGQGWNRVIAPPNDGATYGLAHGPQGFVAVGEYGAIANSLDGVLWTEGSSPTDVVLIDVGYAGGAYTAVGGSGTILRSLDGNTWSFTNTPNTDTLYAVGASPVDLVAVGANGTILTSENGLNWTRAATGTAQELTSFASHGNVDVVVGNRTAFTRTSGGAWTKVTSPPLAFLNCVVYGAGRFVALDSDGGDYTSIDGTVWVAGNGTRGSALRMAFDGSQFVAVGPSGLIVTSPDGLVWTKRETGTIHDFWDVAVKTINA